MPSYTVLQLKPGLAVNAARRPRWRPVKIAAAKACCSRTVLVLRPRLLFARLITLMMSWSVLSWKYLGEMLFMILCVCVFVGAKIGGTLELKKFLR